MVVLIVDFDFDQVCLSFPFKIEIGAAIVLHKFPLKLDAGHIPGEIFKKSRKEKLFEGNGYLTQCPDYIREIIFISETAGEFRDDILDKVCLQARGCKVVCREACTERDPANSGTDEQKRYTDAERSG